MRSHQIEQWFSTVILTGFSQAKPKILQGCGWYPFGAWLHEQHLKDCFLQLEVSRSRSCPLLNLKCFSFLSAGWCG